MNQPPKYLGPLVEAMGQGPLPEARIEERAVPKNSKKFENLIRNAKKIVSYNLDNQFRGDDLDPKKAAQHIIDRAKKIRGAKMYPSHKDGKYTLHIHGNQWYEITPGDQN